MQNASFWIFWRKIKNIIACLTSGFLTSLKITNAKNKGVAGVFVCNCYYLSDLVYHPNLCLVAFPDAKWPITPYLFATIERYDSSCSGITITHKQPPFALLSITSRPLLLKKSARLNPSISFSDCTENVDTFDFCTVIMLAIFSCETVLDYIEEASCNFSFTILLNIFITISFICSKE